MPLVPTLTPNELNETWARQRKRKPCLGTREPRGSVRASSSTGNVSGVAVDDEQTVEADGDRVGIEPELGEAALEPPPGCEDGIRAAPPFL